MQKTKKNKNASKYNDTTVSHCFRLLPCTCNVSIGSCRSSRVQATWPEAVEM